MVGYDKRRQSQRIQPFVAPCRYVVGDERVSAFLTDISRGGGRVNVELEPPAIGTALTIELRLARQPWRFDCPRPFAGRARPNAVATCSG